MAIMKVDLALRMLMLIMLQNAFMIQTPFVKLQ